MVSQAHLNSWRLHDDIQADRVVSHHSNVYLKLEFLQPSGSFKSRGIGNLCLQSLLDSTREEAANTHFYSSSGGNAGLGCVHAAVALGSKSTVVVPLTTSEFMMNKIRDAGASQVIQMGKSWAEADGHLKEVVMPEARARGIKAVYVHPFDQEEVWDGHSFMIDEVVDQLRVQADVKPDVVVCSVGGGGLLAGVMRGLDRHDLGHTTQVLAMETQGADSLSQSVEKGELVTLPAITSKAGSLGARTVCQQALKVGLRDNVRPCVLKDEEAGMACVRFADDERIMLELACGINVATCYNGRLKEFVPSLRKETNAVIIVCGGSNINGDMLHDYKKDWGHLEIWQWNIALCWKQKK